MPEKNKKKSRRKFDSEKESKLEEEIKEEEIPENEIVNEGFSSDFLRIPEGSFSTSLGKTENIQNLEELNKDFSFPQEVGNEEKPEIKYDINYNPSDYENVASERRKITDENIIVRDLFRMSPEDTRVNFQPLPNESHIQLNPELQELRRRSAFREESDYVVDNVQKIEDSGAVLPFERKERKYRGQAI